MKIVSMACPHCGAALQLDADQKNLKCEYCGNSVFVDDEIKHIQIDNAEESGYLFEKGRQLAPQDFAGQGGGQLYYGLCAAAERRAADRGECLLSSGCDEAQAPL